MRTAALKKGLWASAGAAGLLWTLLTWDAYVLVALVAAALVGTQDAR